MIEGNTVWGPRAGIINVVIRLIDLLRQHETLGAHVRRENGELQDGWMGSSRVLSQDGYGESRTKSEKARESSRKVEKGGERLRKFEKVRYGRSSPEYVRLRIPQLTGGQWHGLVQGDRREREPLGE